MSKTPARRAFTIAELLIALPLAALLFCGVAEALADLAAIRAREDDEAAAYARADRVWAILRDSFAHCGYGMPKDPAAYARLFPAIGVVKDTFYTWPGPLSLAPARIDRRARGSCRIVHAAPSGARTTDGSASSADRFTVKMTDRSKRLQPSAMNPHRPENWVIFGGARPPSGPFWLAADGPKSVTLRRTFPTPEDAETVTIPANDELFYLRVTEAEAVPYGADDWAFVTDRHDGSGRQPRVIGVVDARFALAPSGRTVKTHLLIRGDCRYGEEITPGTPPGWPEAYAADIPDEARHYRLYAFEMTFGLHNMF